MAAAASKSLGPFAALMPSDWPTVRKLIREAIPIIEATERRLRPGLMTLAKSLGAPADAIDAIDDDPLSGLERWAKQRYGRQFRGRPDKILRRIVRIERKRSRRSARSPGRCHTRHVMHRGRSRAARCAAPRLRGSRRTAARVAQSSTGPPGSDDGGGQPEPPSRWTTTGADRRTERTKTARRATCIVWTGGGASRRVAETRNDESPRSWRFAGIPSRAVRRELAGQTARILADSCPAKQPPHRATEAASGG